VETKTGVFLLLLGHIAWLGKDNHEVLLHCIN
jgi:hypothetical protein